ncbi:MAG: hypothetical protein V4585_02155 [Bacteroidota bacterium]
MNDDKLKNDIEKLLNPLNIKNNLIKSSLYLSAFELLKLAIENRLRDFLCGQEEMNEDFEFKTSQKYRDVIENRKISELGGNKNIYYSSCLWLKEMDVITHEEVLELQEIRKHRNKIAHQLPLLIIDSAHNVDLKLFDSIKKLLKKIEQWWIVEFEMAINTKLDDIDSKDINFDEIRSGNMILLDLIIDSVSEAEL